jgi:hypothetical protein
MVKIETFPSLGGVVSDDPARQCPPDDDENREGAMHTSEEASYSSESKYDYSSDDQSESSAYDLTASVNRHMDRLQLQPPESLVLDSKMKNLNLTGPDVHSDQEVSGIPTLEGHSSTLAITHHGVVPTDDENNDFPLLPWQTAAEAVSTDDGVHGTTGAAPEAGDADVESFVRSGDASISRMWDQNTPPNALTLSFEPPYHLLFKGSFHNAVKLAREQKKLLLVSIQDYEHFGSHLVNRDILGDDFIRNVLKSEFVVWQTTTDNREGYGYVTHYKIGAAPHLGVVHPTHKTIIWGVDGWTAEKPWSGFEISRSLVEIRFDRFHEEHMAIDIDLEETETEEGWPEDDLYMDISQRLAIQDALHRATEVHSLHDDADELIYALELQCVLLTS